MLTLIEQVAQKVLEIENVTAKAEISICLTDNKHIRQLNKDYRLIDSATDVLSFPQTGGKNELLNLPPGEILLGDVVISMEKADAQSKEYGHSLEREVGFLTAHGVLHLLGYDHENDNQRAVMRQKEEQVLESVGLLR
jgi:probable rRNA maturation factor